jgi:hypothetical protein
MKHVFIILAIMASTWSALLGQTYVDKTVTIGDTIVSFPIPAHYVQLERNMPLAADFFKKKEHAHVEESKNNTFILAALTPERFTEAGKDGKLSGSLDCWAMYGNFSTERRISSSQFSKLTSEAEIAINASRKTGNFYDALGVKAQDFKDEVARKRLEKLEIPQIISKTPRSMVTMVKMNDEFILHALCMINGKLIMLYMQKRNPFDGIDEMGAWVKEIETRTLAEYRSADLNSDSVWQTLATVLALVLTCLVAAAAVVFAFKPKKTGG